MKNILPIILIVFVSTSVNAEKSMVTPQSEGIEEGTYFKQLPVVTKVDTNSAVSENEAKKYQLWKNLDSNNDELLSKAETVSSKMIYKHWNELDSNEDNTLDFIEFLRMPEEEN